MHKQGRWTTGSTDRVVRDRRSVYFYEVFSPQVFPKFYNANLCASSDRFRFTPAWYRCAMLLKKDPGVLVVAALALAGLFYLVYSHRIGYVELAAGIALLGIPSIFGRDNEAKTEVGKPSLPDAKTEPKADEAKADGPKDPPPAPPSDPAA